MSLNKIYTHELDKYANYPFKRESSLLEYNNRPSALEMELSPYNVEEIPEKYRKLFENSIKQIRSVALE